MRRRRGFTLIELVVTVSVIGILGSLAAYTMIRSRRRISLERANLTVRGLLERARALSAVAGSRVGTNRLVYGAGCTDETLLNPGDPTQWQLWVRYDGAGQLEVPLNVQASGNDTLTVNCETFDISLPTPTGVVGAFSFPLAPGDLAFSPAGRVILRNIPGPYAYFQVQNPVESKVFGVRVLPSGVICQSSVAAGPPWCD